MKNAIITTAVLFTLGLAAAPSQASPQCDNLLKTKLEVAKDTDVIVSHVTVAPNTELAKHWHPGEQFAYVIKGKVTLSIEGKEDIVGTAGDTLHIPLKVVHSVKTGEEGAVAVLFRVHESGKPERYAVH